MEEIEKWINDFKVITDKWNDSGEYFAAMFVNDLLEKENKNALEVVQFIVSLLTTRKLLEFRRESEGLFSILSEYDLKEDICYYLNSCFETEDILEALEIKDVREFAFKTMGQMEVINGLTEFRQEKFIDNLVVNKNNAVKILGKVQDYLYSIK